MWRTPFLRTFNRGMQSTFTCKRCRGVTLLEVLIATSITAIGLASVAAVMSTALTVARNAEDASAATQAAKAAITELITTQAYAFPSGEADEIDSSDATQRTATGAPAFDSGHDHEFPFYCLWDENIPWQSLVEIVAARDGHEYVLVKKNSPGGAERRKVSSIQVGNGRAWIRIDRGELGEPSDEDYLDRSQDWIWPVGGGARYWLGNFREDRLTGRFPAYARVVEVMEDSPGEFNRLRCQVVQESTDESAGDWGPPSWPTNCWKGFVLVHTGEHQEITPQGEAYPTETAAAVGGPYLITGNEGDILVCERADFQADRVRAGDFVRLAGNAAGRVWWPEGFLGPGTIYTGGDLVPPRRRYNTVPAEVGTEGYSYGCIFSGWENDLPNLYRIDVFVYRDFDRTKPPERNRPIANFGTLLYGR